MQASIALSPDATQQYLLRIADTCLVLAQRTSEWCGHGPILEEDIALANMALDLIGQARALLAHAGTLGETRYDEDQLAFLRDERDYRNITLVELPRGDFAFTVVRNVLVASFLKAMWARLATESTDAELAAIAAKALKEARYHQQHAADWLLRLADGTPESRCRTESALGALWPYTAELFEADAIDEAARTTGLGPSWGELREPWLADITPLFQAAALSRPAASAFRSTGKHGRHSEHMGFLLAEMQHLQRAYPGGTW
ncbi:phenylacetate-CoA oxygenase subunit PaaC [Aquincola sp. S2]|uniref:Phenylacetate-CoA oxygenase subunit PaaC n=1 Tax=Pseudaquabacterium terrae TaxID=2732868 RepID=A0ABX2EFJ0_9BURK|nr:1,2-phenylacetyl-CoA epoxidase subunit PaaC [Aquabacterium terrae]NRF67360.1 phenylacetate-CoA oxygenase subunit PaaC [Aquabacterium terrae]